MRSANVWTDGPHAERTTVRQQEDITVKPPEVQEETTCGAHRGRRSGGQRVFDFPATGPSDRCTFGPTVIVDTSVEWCAQQSTTRVVKVPPSAEQWETEHVGLATAPEREPP